MSPFSDQKRLLAGFLAIATLVGLLGFSFENIFSENKLSKEPISAKENSAPKKIFSSEYFETPSGVSVSSVEHKPEYNLTDDLVAGLAQGLASANPNGPEIINGASGFSSPGFEDFLYEYSFNAISKGDLASLAKQASPQALKPGELKLGADSENAIKIYLSRWNKLWAEKLNTPEISSILDGSYNPAGLNALELSLRESLLTAQQTEAPESYRNLHALLIQFFHHSISMVETISLGTEDPIKTTLLSDLQIESMKTLSEDVSREMRKLKLSGLVLLPEEKTFTQEILGIESANALVLVPIYDPVAFGTKIGEMIKRLVLDIIKDRLVHRLVQQVIGWIQGRGTPQFVTNWKGFFKDVANTAAGQALDEIAPELCQSFGPMIRINFMTQQGRSVAPVKCTLDEVVGNVQSFYDNFQNGGWLAYGAALEPTNNYFGSMITVNDAVIEAAEEAREAAESKAKAGSGFTGQEKCVAGDPEEVYDQTYNACIQRRTLSAGAQAMGGTFADLPEAERLQIITSCNSEATIARNKAGSCKETSVTTPGGTQKDILDQTMLGPLHRIVNAKDVVALASALVNAALSKLFQSGQRGLLGVSAGGGQQRLPNMCRGLSGSDFSECERTACKDMPEEYRAECQAGIIPPEENFCQAGETVLQTPNASGADPSGTAGVLCDNDSFTLTRASYVSLSCDGGRDGKAFLTEGHENCNDRPDLGTAGWTFSDDLQNAFGLDGAPVSFVSSIDCPGGEEILYLRPGEYSVGRWGSTGGPAYACQLQGPTRGGAPGNFSTSTPVILNINPNPSWPGTLMIIQAQNPAGNVYIRGTGVNFETPISGLAVNSSTGRVFLRTPNLQPGAYSVYMGSSTGMSAPYNLIIREKRDEDVAVAAATDGWAGGIASNGNSNTWLTVSTAGGFMRIVGRIMNNDSSALTDQFTIATPTAGASSTVGQVRAVYSPDLGRFLVVYGRELGRGSGGMFGRFVSTSGELVGEEISLTPGLAGVPNFVGTNTATTDIRYDSSRQGFVVAFSVNNNSAYMVRVGRDGSVSQPVRVDGPGNEYAPDIDVDRDGNYCAIFHDDSGNVYVKHIDGTTLLTSPAVQVGQGAGGATNIVYNSQENVYLVGWGTSSDNPTGRILRDCQSSPTTPRVGLASDVLLSNIAYNPISNSYGIVGVGQSDIYNIVTLLRADLSTITTLQVFFDGTNGNYVPTIAPNLADGTFGVASSLEYGTYRIGTDVGGALLRR